MKLNERLRQAEEKAGRPAPDGESPSKGGGDPYAGFKQRAQEALFVKLGPRLYDASLSEEDLQEIVSTELDLAMEGEAAPFSEDERRAIARQIREDILGYGPIHMFLEDESITEIMVNAEELIYIERDGKIEETEARFASRQHLRRVIDRIVAQVGRRIDESSPMVDARLPDGSRVNAVIPPLSVDGPVLTIRVFAKDPFQVADLIEMGTMSPEVADLIQSVVEGKLNVLVSGGTGTGKTTMLNVLSGFIPGDERVVTIEDAVELQLHQRHVIRLESRPPNVEGRGEVKIRDLVRNALRMRPDRIVVGEVRGGEALDMLQAMNTGHEGSLSTVHSNSPRDTLSRLETMVLMAGVDLPARAIREQISAAVDLIVHLSRLRDGTRRIVQISEVVGMEGDTITIQDVFRFDYAAGRDEEGRFLGEIKPTGIRPQFTDKLRDFGIEIPAAVFGAASVPPGRNGRGGKRQS
ncbi:MAG: CpaF family protein [Acidimicrobiia bacterium]|nr:CpaF family protein [Acidimicrobiia bacterium]